LAFVLWALVAPEGLGSVMGDVLAWIIGNFGWGFILIAVGALGLCVFS
jgi:glycine betaine transporter